MPVYRINNKTVLFVHIPKCAGTSIESMLRAHPDCQGHAMYEMGRDNLMIVVGNCSPQHYHAEILMQTINLSNIDICFSIVRDPVQRLLSEHSMQIVKFPGTTTNFSQWYVEMQEKRVLNPFCFDNHLRPSKEFLLQDAFLYDLHIGMDKIWRDICTRVDIDPSLSAIQHIRPCDGPLQDSIQINETTLNLIAQDYSDDCAIHATLQQHWKQGFQWQDLQSML